MSKIFLCGDSHILFKIVVESLPCVKDTRNTNVRDGICATGDNLRTGNVLVRVLKMLNGLPTNFAIVFKIQMFRLVENVYNVKP